MVILGTLTDSYIINGDGTSISSVQISAPGNINDYSMGARSAIVSDKLFLFGGDGVDTSYRKVKIFHLLRNFTFFRSQGSTLAHLLSWQLG